jgi:hypothetical protein
VADEGEVGGATVLRDEPGRLPPLAAPAAPAGATWALGRASQKFALGELEVQLHFGISWGALWPELDGRNLALGSGYVAEVLGGSLSWVQYRNECLRVLTLHDAVPATLKPVAFGFVVGVVGCYFGMDARGGTEGVGRAATGSVVVSIFLLLVCDVVLVKVIQVLS